MDDAETNHEQCWRDNVTGPAILAEEAERRRIAFTTFSTDLVFDGLCQEPYLEDARVAPLNVYGGSKAQSEREVLERMPGALVIRTAAFFGPDDSANFVTTALREIRAGRPFRTSDSLVISPTYVPDLASAALELTLDRTAGLCHLSNGEPMTWAALAHAAARLVGLDSSLVQACPVAELGLVATRPAFSALRSKRSGLMPSFELALDRYARAFAAA